MCSHFLTHTTTYTLIKCDANAKPGIKVRNNEKYSKLFRNTFTFYPCYNLSRIRYSHCFSCYKSILVPSSYF